MRKQIATVVSNVINPFLVGLAVIPLISFAASSTPREALKWALIASALSILPVFVIVLYFVRTGRVVNFFASIREQRTRLYVAAGLCTIAGGIMLFYLGAPQMLVAAFAVVLSCAVIFMFINLWWKISLHTAVVAASATVVVILYGWTGIVTITLVPLTAWARIETKSHSLAQVTTGALLASLIVIGVFYPLGLA